MCGIAGIIQSSPQFDLSAVKKMTDVIAHRGPDGEKFWQNNERTVLFGHRRLSIIDLSENGAQPMHYLDSYTIIHNGEIYNYIELREELKKKGYLFNSQSDTEVILAAYDHWKEDCLDEFDGMFAFVIYDQKEKEIFAARDRFGEKPFFYSYNEKQQSFCFASEMKAIWALQPKSPNLKMLFNFLTIGYVDNPNYLQETFDDNIEKLPSGQYLKIRIEPTLQITAEKYWDLEFEKEEKISDTDAIEKFNQLFSESVNRRLRSDVSLGTSLSGGLDSSSIVAGICKPQTSNLSTGQAGLKLQTFSAIFPSFEKNEERYIDLVAKTFNLQSFKTEISSNDITGLLEKVMRQQDEPIGSASSVAQYCVFALAKENNVKVLLDGQGADETLAGYTKYYKWYWQELFSKRKLYRSKELKAAKDNGITESFGIKNIIASLVPDFASVFLERQYLLKALQQEDLAREFVQMQSKEAYYSTPTIFSLNGVLYFNTCTHGLDELLRYADRNSMAHGREVRLPFLSHKLVEFIFSLPSDFKIRNGQTKWLLRKSMENKLPGDIINRKDKIGFEPPQRTWMQLPEVQQMITKAKKKLVDEKVLKASVLEKSIQATSAYEKDNRDWKYLAAAQLFSNP